MAKKYGHEGKIKRVVLDRAFYELAYFKGKKHLALFRDIFYLELNNARNLEIISTSTPSFPIDIIHGKQDYVVAYENLEQFKELLVKKKGISFYTHKLAHYEENGDQRLSLIIGQKSKNAGDFSLSFDSESKKWSLDHS